MGIKHQESSYLRAFYLHAYKLSITYVPIRHLSTSVENVRQISLFLQNKTNFPCFSTENEDYAKKQTQFKPNQSQFWPKNQGGKAKQTQFKPKSMS